MGGVSDLEHYLQSFEADPGYLNWASYGPLAPAVRAEALADVELLATGRPTGIELVAGRVREARSTLATFLDCRDDEVVLQPSTSQGLTHAFFGLSGDVLLSPYEFPALTIGARRAHDALGRLRVVDLEDTQDGVTVDAVRGALTDDVTAVAVSLVDYRTGYLADLAGIRDVIGDRLLIVDAIQALGVVDVDWSLADVVCGNGYKWLRAGRGSGYARFSDRARDVIEPVLSGTGGMDGVLGDLEVPPPLGTAQAYVISPSDPVSAARLDVGLREVAAAGVPRIAERVAERARAVFELADAHGIPVLTSRERHAGIVTLVPDAAALGALGAALANNGLTVTTRGGTIRVSVHAGTTDETLQRLGDAFAEAAVTATHILAPALPEEPALTDVVVLSADDLDGD